MGRKIIKQLNNSMIDRVAMKQASVRYGFSGSVEGISRGDLLRMTGLPTKDGSVRGRRSVQIMPNEDDAILDGLDTMDEHTSTAVGKFIEAAITESPIEHSFADKIRKKTRTVVMNDDDDLIEQLLQKGDN